MRNISLTLRHAIITLVFLGVVTVFTGCRNTAHGMGEDIERSGEAIQDKTD